MEAVAVGAEPRAQRIVEASRRPSVTLARRRIGLDSTPTIVALCMFGGLVLRIALLARPITTLDRLFVPDDTYYTLAIARSIAHGAGPRSGAGPLTSGFQPLIAFLMVPVYWLGAGNWTALRIDMAILALADVVTVGALAWIAHRVAGRLAAICAAVLWALSPLAIGVAIGGLETSLAIMLEALLVIAWLRVRDRRDSTRRWIVLGVLAGLAVLARVDALILIACIVLFEGRQMLTRHAAFAAASCAAVLAPWWIWCIVHFGSPIPASGTAVRRHPFIAPWAARILSVAVGSVVSAPFSDTAAMKAFLVTKRPLGVALYLAAMAFLAVCATVAWRRTRNRGAESAAPAAVGVLATFAAALLLFYAWYGFSSYITRYLAPAALFVALALAAVLTAQRDPSRSRSVVVVVVAIALLTASVAGDVAAFARSKAPAATATASLTGGSSNGRAQATREALALLPDGARVGAWQSGALAYFADRNIRVLNLDGVVNPDAPDMRNPSAMARYIKARQLDWLVDWAILEAPFVNVGRFTLKPAPGVQTVASVKQDNGLRVTVLRLVWDITGRLKAYFAGPGALYRRFAAASAPLLATTLTHAQCLDVAQRLVPIGGKEALERAASAAPDSRLATLMRGEVDSRYLTLFACLSTRSKFHATPPGIRSEQARNTEMRQDLVAFGAGNLVALSVQG